MLTPAGALPAGNIQTLRHEPTQFAVPEGMGAFGWIPSMSWFCCVSFFFPNPSSEMCARNQRRYWARLGATEKCSWSCGCYLKQRCVSKINIWVIIVACHISFVTAVGISSTCTIRLDWRRYEDGLTTSTLAYTLCKWMDQFKPFSRRSGLSDGWNSKYALHGQGQKRSTIYK